MHVSSIGKTQNFVKSSQGDLFPSLDRAAFLPLTCPSAWIPFFVFHGLPVFRRFGLVRVVTPGLSAIGDTFASLEGGKN